MAKKPDFDLTAAHKYFAVYCFNQAWDYIDKPNRTSKDNDVMLALSLTSLWHWTQREDCTPTNLSIGYWQVSRVLSLIGQAENAKHYGELCLEVSQSVGILPFYLGYAYEALARAASVAGNRADTEMYLAKANEAAGRIKEKGDKDHLLKDLVTIQ